MSFGIEGLVRGTIDTLRKIAVGPQGNVFISKFMPDYAQLVAEGRVWRANETTATASVTALPTTAGLFTLGNNEPDNGLLYVVIAVYGFNSANAVALDNWALAGVLSQRRAVTGGLDVTMARDIAAGTGAVNQLGGSIVYNGNAILDEGVTVTDDRWFPLGMNSGSTAINSATGGAVWHWLHGLVVLPPKTLFSMASTATSASNTTRKGVVWAEVPRSYLLG